MRFIGLLGGLVAVLAYSGSALAASQSARNDCNTNDPDRSIAGCTQVLQDKSERRRPGRVLTSTEAEPTV